jgi:hypothetical protein
MRPLTHLTRHLLSGLWVLVVGLGSPLAHGQSAATPSGDLPAPRVVMLQGHLEPGRLVEVHLDGLAEWSRTQGHTPWRLVPFIDGRALPGLYPIAVNLRDARVQFHLLITPESQAAWTQVLSPLAFERAVRFSVGLELQDPFDTVFTREGQPATLKVVNPRWVAAAATVLLVFSVAFCALATRTTLLMEHAIHAPGREVTRFSLAKVQLALWFFVVFGAFLVIWLVTGNFNTINSTIVATLGVSVGTAVGDEYLKSAQPLSRSAEVSAPPPPPPEAWALARFVRELVSDGDGYSIYRFQMVAWTVALVIVFLADVYDDLVMPSFGPELLYLLGVSSGTYVAHRVPEMVRDRSRPDPSTPAASIARPPSPASAASPEPSPRAAQGSG